MVHFIEFPFDQVCTVKLGWRAVGSDLDTKWSNTVPRQSMADTRSYFEYYWFILSLFEWYQVDKPLLWAHACSDTRKFPRNQNARFDEIGVSSSIWDLKSLRCIDHWCPDSIFKPFFKIRFHVREKSSPDLWHKLISFSQNYATTLVELHRITNKIHPKSLHCIDLEHPDIIFKAF